MSDIIDQIQRIETLRRRVEDHGKLSSETLKRIEYRFRLECNYFSNRQEGGTLTREETRTVMIGNISVDKKPLKDIIEMKGHDEEMMKIMRIAQGEVRISENRIKHIHRNIISEEDPENQKLMGQWKKDANKIYNSKGEEYSFTPPDEVSDKMHQLINWLGKEIEKVQRNDKNAIHPLVLAFDFHIRFLTIHPFHDGNGRTGRLLSNLLLVSYGYPPFYITDEEKDAYNRYLTDIQSYGGDPETFYGFMAGLVARSMQLSLDVIEGQDNYMDDLAKKLRLLKVELPVKPIMSVMRSKKTIQEITKESVLPTIENFVKEATAFNEYFSNKKMIFKVERNSITKGFNVQPDYSRLEITRIDNISVAVMKEVGKIKLDDSTTIFITFEYNLNGFKNASLIPFGISVGLRWQLDEYAYSFSFVGHPIIPELTHYYSEFYSLENIKTIKHQADDLLLKQIENNLGRFKSE